MRRLLSLAVLGIFCLALLPISANAGLYDPRNPPPTPYIDVNDDLNNGEIGWDTPAQSAGGEMNLDQPMAESSGSITVSNVNAETKQGWLEIVIKGAVLSILLPKILKW